MSTKLALACMLLLTSLFGLSACAPASVTNGPIPTATEQPHGTPDVRVATPQIGFAHLPQSQGPQPLLLHSLPDETSAISGEIFPGDEGTILGLDASQKWVLVQFGDTTGWTPVNTLALTIAQ